MTVHREEVKALVHREKGDVPQGPPADPVGNQEITADLGYRAIIDLLPCYVSIQDPTLHILFTNKNFEKDFGHGIGRICYEVYKKADERCPSCPVQRSLEDRRAHVSEETVELANGEVAELVIYSAPILDIFGNVRAVIELSGNVSRLKKVHKELAFLGQSIAVLSHDIKNILEGLQGGAYVVEEGIKDRDMDLAGQGWEVVKRNICEISSVVQDILYSSKERVFKKEGLYLDRFVNDVVSMFREKAGAMDITLETKVNPVLPLVHIDPSGIRRMLNNLLWNALEACKADKEKRFHRVVLKADFYNGFHFMFEVEDNGIGMDDSTRKKIFTECYSTKGHGGTGLGLYVVDKVVKGHGGCIEVLTTPGKGTTFRIILPIR